MNNDLDEAIVRGDDGKAYVMYADTLHSDLRVGARVNHQHLTGEVVSIAREEDIGPNALRVRLLGSGVMFVGGIVASQATLGASFLLSAAAPFVALDALYDSHFGEQASETPRDPSTLDAMRLPRIRPTEPEMALRPAMPSPMRNGRGPKP